MRKASDSIQFTKKPYVEDVGPRRIESIKFSMFSETEILKASEVQVFRGVYYDANKKPIDHGLLDPRMGPPNKNGVCKTCHGNFRECPGHSGYLTLSLPVYNVGYLSIIVDILKCICKKCSRVLLEEKDRRDFLKKMRNPKLEPLWKKELQKRVIKKCNTMTGSKKAVRCSRCGYINGVVKKALLGVQHDRAKVVDNYLEKCSTSLSHGKESKGKLNTPPVIDAKAVHSLFRNMLDEDCELLYLNDRPEKLIMTNILVPPIAIRPSVFVDGGTRR